MLSTRWRLFRMMGIPVYIHPSWLIILALLSVTVAGLLPDLVHRVYPGAENQTPAWGYWIVGFLAAMAFFVCIVLHEFGHAIAARNQGMPTRGITLFLFGGVAELGEEPPSPSAEFIMAIAGPVVSVVLALFLGGLAAIGYYAAWPPLIVIALGYLSAINFMVLIFNLIPAFPLDGGRVLRSILWGASGSLRKATWWAAGAGRVFSWILIGWGVLQFFAGNPWGGLWMGLIGLFLNQAANSSYSQVVLRQALEGEPIRRFMNPEPIAVAPTVSLREWVDDYVYRYHRKAFPVVNNGRLQGYIQTQDLARVPREEWDIRTVADEMRTDLAAISVPSNGDALSAFKQMQRTGLSRLLVVDDGGLVGIVSIKDLLRLLSLKMELEGSYQSDMDEDENGFGTPNRPREPVVTANDRWQRQ